MTTELFVVTFVRYPHPAAN